MLKPEYPVNNLENLPVDLRNNMEMLTKMKSIQNAKEKLELAKYEKEVEEIANTDLREDYVLTDEEKKEYENTIRYEEFENMHMIEVLTIRKAIYRNLVNMAEGKRNILSYLSMKKFFEDMVDTMKQTDPNSTASIDDIVSNKDEIEADVEKFRETFAKDFAKFKYGIKLCDDRIAKFDNPDSLKFITSELLYSFSKTDELLDESLSKGTIIEKDYKKRKSANDVCKTAVNSRFDLTYVKKKFSYDNKSFKDHVKKAIKNISEKRFERTDRIIGENMRTENLKNVIDFLKERYKDKKYGDLFSEILLDYSAHMLKSGINTGHFVYWKMLIGNISAIITDNFDMDVDKDIYLASIDELYPEFEKTYLEFQ